MPADINKKVYRVRAQGLRRKRLLLEPENQCGFELWILVGKCNRLLLFNPFCFEAGK